jgi:hypothetical protein
MRNVSIVDICHVDLMSFTGVAGQSSRCRRLVFCHKIATLCVGVGNEACEKQQKVIEVVHLAYG